MHKTPMPRTGKANFWLFAFLGVLTCVLFLAIAPADATPVGSWRIPDKLEHFVAFLVLGFLLRPAAPLFSFLVQFLLLAAIAAGIEAIQGATPYERTQDGMDWIASSAGAAAGLALALFAAPRLRAANLLPTR